MFKETRLKAFLLLSVVVAAWAAQISLARIQLYMRPFIDKEVYEGIRLIGEVVREENLREPVIVFYGTPSKHHLNKYRVRDYLEGEVGSHLAYYGRLQWLLHLLKPTLMEPDLSFSFFLKPDVSLPIAFYEELVEAFHPEILYIPFPCLLDQFHGCGNYRSR